MIPQRISYDPAWGFTALKEFMNGTTPSVNHLTSPAPEDLSRDTTRWIYWWPPSSQFLVYPLMRTGLTLEQAVRLIVLFCIGFGALGWSIWVSRFDLPLSWKIALATGLPWMRYASNTLFRYSTETFVFGFAPWILLATALLAQRWKSGKTTRAAVAATGILFALSYWIKYTLVFIPIGCALYLTFQAARSGKRRQLFELAFAIGSLIFGVFSLNLVNWFLSKQLNPISATLHPSFRWEDLFFAFSFFPMALADANSFWKFAFMHPAYGLFTKFPNAASIVKGTSMWLGWVGLPGVGWIIWSIAHRRRGHKETDLSTVCALTAFCLILALFIVSRVPVYESRYIAAAGIAILPLCLQTLSSTKPGWKKIVFSTMAAFYVWLPLIGGAAAIGVHAAKGRFFGLRPDLSDVIPKDLQAGKNEDNVWVVTDPRHALQIRGRTIIIVDQNLRTYRSSKPLSVSLILSPDIERNGYGERVRKSFPQVASWEKRQLEGTALIEWTAEIRTSKTDES